MVTVVYLVLKLTWHICYHRKPTQIVTNYVRNDSALWYIGFIISAHAKENNEETLKKGWYISVLGVDVSRDDMSQISHPHDNLSKQWKNSEKTVKK